MPACGGVGLCEYVQHLSIFDYIAGIGSLENRVIEYLDHLHEYFVEPVLIQNAHYMPPKLPGYFIVMKPESLRDYRFRNGKVWQEVLTASAKHLLNN